MSLSQYGIIVYMLLARIFSRLFEQPERGSGVRLFGFLSVLPKRKNRTWVSEMAQFLPVSAQSSIVNMIVFLQNFFNRSFGSEPDIFKIKMYSE